MSTQFQPRTFYKSFEKFFVVLKAFLLLDTDLHELQRKMEKDNNYFWFLISHQVRQFSVY